MNGSDVIAAINHLCMLYAQSRLAYAHLESATTPEDYDRLLAEANRLEFETNEHYRTLTSSIVHALPDTMRIAEFLPVQPLPTGEIAIHAHDDQGRQVRLKLSGDQALAAGTHLIAHAAVSLDRAGLKHSEALPPLSASPPATPAGPARATASVPVVPAPERETR